MADIKEIIKLGALQRKYRCSGRGCDHRFRGGDFALMVNNGTDGFYCLSADNSSCATEGAPDDVRALARLEAAGDHVDEQIEIEAEAAMRNMEPLADNGRRWVHYQKHTLNRKEREIRVPAPYQAQLDTEAKAAAEKTKGRKAKAAA